MSHYDEQRETEEQKQFEAEQKLLDTAARVRELNKGKE